MASWSFSNGLDYGLNDTWSIAYEMKQKNIIGEKASLWLLLGVGLVSLFLLWRLRRRLRIKTIKQQYLSYA
ncbi:hypothetical protein J4466_04035 [Candidatus Pacearchaeota archaeon]|nr:hypothetical protein [Candidatus Pacearchaeota archaeon]